MASVPKIQNAQYGDSAKLEQLGAGRLTKNPAASVQEWKDPVGGRPPETDPVKLATRPQRGRSRPQQLSPEEIRYQRKFNTLSMQEKTLNKWIALAQSPNAGPFTKSYAMAVVKSFQKSLLEVRKSTPFFEDD